ncbi:MAG: hypothetical protein U0354_08715 [Candidatus Sericytochromatia bacterium]
MVKNKNTEGLELINRTIKKYSKIHENNLNHEVFKANINEINYSFVRINDEQYINFAKNSISIEEDYVFMMYLYRQDTIFSDFAKFYVTLKELTGESGNLYDEWKGAFSFPFLISFSKNNKEYEYIMNVSNVRASIEFKFRKLIHENDPRPRIYIESPFEDFPKDEINHFIAYLIGFSNGYFKSYVSKTWDKFFYKSIKSENTIFGYKDGKFFEKKYEKEANYNKKLKKLEDFKSLK